MDGMQLPPILRVGGTTELSDICCCLDVMKDRMRNLEDGTLKRTLDYSHKQQVLAARAEIRKYCTKYRALRDPAVPDFSTLCSSGHTPLNGNPGVYRPGLCRTCNFYVPTAHGTDVQPPEPPSTPSQGGIPQAGSITEAIGGPLEEAS